MTATSRRAGALASVLIAGTLLAGCAPALQPATMTGEASMSESAAEPEGMTLETEMAGPTAGPMVDEAAMQAPAFLSVSLTDVATGTVFTLGDFMGKVVLLEPFAQWCPTCLRQQREVARLLELSGMRDDLVSVALDIDPNEDAAMLQEYIGQHGFDWLYAVAPAEMAREIGELYGSQYLNPPSAPMLVIDRNGTIHPLPFGPKTADDLLEALEPFLAESM